VPRGGRHVGFSAGAPLKAYPHPLRSRVTMTPDAEIWSIAIAAALGVILTWVAYSDFRARRIPNASILAILGLFVFWTIVHHFTGLGGTLLCAALVLLITFGLSIAKIFGAGDAKLLTVLALFMGPNHLLGFLAVTALAGGGLAIMALAVNPWRMRSSGSPSSLVARGVPYGVAIAIGGAVTMVTSLLNVI